MTEESANVIAPPPLIFLLALGIGFALGLIFPAPVLPGAPPFAIGLVLTAAGTVLGAAAFAAMRRAHTSPDPSEPTRALVDEGPFRYSRNPIYVAFTLIYSGIAVAFQWWWALALLPLVLIIVERGVIEREEKYLERKFSDAYLQYKRRVRRWL